MYFPHTLCQLSLLPLWCQDMWWMWEPSRCCPESCSPRSRGLCTFHSHPLAAGGSWDCFQPLDLSRRGACHSQAEAWLPGSLPATVILGDTCREASATRWHLNRSLTHGLDLQGNFREREMRFIYCICFSSLLWANTGLLNTSHSLPWNWIFFSSSKVWPSSLLSSFFSSFLHSQTIYGTWTTYQNLYWNHNDKQLKHGSCLEKL